jgi:multidrug resistance efflux pump
MLLGISLVVIYAVGVYLVFFKFKWLKFTIVWGIVGFWVGVHMLLIFMIGLRFNTPYTIDAHLIRNTIQIVPRLEGPTLLEEVLVESNVAVKKGDPLYRFDTSTYEAKVQQAEAQLAAAQQNVLINEASVQPAGEQLVQAQAELNYALAQQERFTNLASQGGARQEDVDKWNAEVESDQAAVKAAQANLEKAVLTRDSNINGVNTDVAQAQAQLEEAQYYLGQTTIYAPADGFIVNQQARPGLVVGDFRVGAIAALVTDEEPYMLAGYYQEHIKFVEPGQPVEIALDIAPGEIFTGTVKSIWWATGQGQYLPSGRIPDFLFPKFQGRFAVQVVFDDPENTFLPAGAHGAVAIYTGRSEGFTIMRKINIRMYSWMNFLFPLDL